MAVIPDKIQDQIQFCEDHLPAWSNTPARIGLTEAQISELQGLTESARAAFEQAQLRRQAAKAATTELRAAVASMRTAAADLVRQIKAFAALQSEPASIYALAQIPEPAAPTPLPPPGVPTDFVVTLEPTGAVTLSWTATDASASSGAFFNVFRRLPGQGGFSPIGGASGSTAERRRMSFTDTTAPTAAAAAGIQYVVRGQRGTAQGSPSPAVTVQFGTDSSGSATGLQFSVTPSGQVRLAA